MIDRIQWLGHASFRIQGPPLIYINPWHVARNAFHADVILVTSDQYDHCSPSDIDKLRGPNTVVVASPLAAAAIGDHATVLRPWQSLNIGSARVTAVPAYTFTNHHPVSKGELGFVISLDYYDIYYAGSTDVIPELEHIQADVAILPIAAGQGTMSIEQAASLVNRMKPSWVIASHWGTIGGTHLDVQALARQVGEHSKVVMLDKMR